MTKNFSKLTLDMKLQIQETQKTPNSMNARNTTPRLTFSNKRTSKIKIKFF